MNPSFSFRVRQADWQQDQPQLRAVRHAVFVAELGIPEALEWDGRDADATHFIAESETGAALGTLRLLPGGRIGRMAVLRACRGKGIGTALLAAALQLARDRRIGELSLHAQVTAVAFYQRFGFRGEGPVFEAAGIPHQAMRLTVQ